MIRVLDGYGEMLPPYRPPGAEDEDVMDLHGCLNWSLLLLKCQIRLGVWNYSTPPPVVPAPSHGKTAATPSADPGHHPTDIDVAQDRSNTNTNTLLARVDDFYEEHGGCDMDDLFLPAFQEPNLGAKDSSHPSRCAEMNSNNKRRQ